MLQDSLEIDDNAIANFFVFEQRSTLLNFLHLFRNENGLRSPFHRVLLLKFLLLHVHHVVDISTALHRLMARVDYGTFGHGSDRIRLRQAI